MLRDGQSESESLSVQYYVIRLKHERTQSLVIWHAASKERAWQSIPRLYAIQSKYSHVNT